MLDNQNPAPDIRNRFPEPRQFPVVLLDAQGGKRITVTGEYDRSTVHSNIDYLLLPFLCAGRFGLSRQRAHSHLGHRRGLPAYAGMAPKLTFGGSLVISSGSRPTSQYYQPLARLSIPLESTYTGTPSGNITGYAEKFYLSRGSGRTCS